MKSCDVCPEAGKIGLCCSNHTFKVFVCFRGLVTQPRPSKVFAGVECGSERWSQLSARQPTARRPREDARTGNPRAPEDAMAGVCAVACPLCTWPFSRSCVCIREREQIFCSGRRRQLLSAAHRSQASGCCPAWLWAPRNHKTLASQACVKCSLFCLDIITCIVVFKD